jgi:tetratricopeptide (TPR) repeat protein
MLDYLREAEPLADALGDLHRMGRVAVCVAGGLYNAAGHLEQVAASGERALAIARTVGDLGLEAQANHRLGQAYMALGEYPRAIDAFKRNVDTLVGDLQTERFGMAGMLAVHSRASMSWCLTQLGEFPAAMAAGEEAVRMAEAADDRFGLVLSQFMVGTIHLRRGDPERALPWLERSLDSSRRFNFEIMSALATYGLGEARAVCGDTVEALPLLEQAAQRAASMRFAAGLHSALGALGEGYLLAGRPAEARQAAERMLGLTRAMGHRYGEAEALRLLGEVHALTNPAEASQAEVSYREALAIAEQIGARPLAAHCHLGLGKLYRRAGKQQEAQEHVTTAATMYREMGMQSWLERGEAEQKMFER